MILDICHGARIQKIWQTSHVIRLGPALSWLHFGLAWANRLQQSRRSCSSFPGNDSQDFSGKESGNPRIKDSKELKRAVTEHSYQFLKGLFHSVIQSHTVNSHM